MMYPYPGFLGFAVLTYIMLYPVSAPVQHKMLLYALEGHAAAL